MMRSLFSGVAGLKTHQTRMDVIGNNIANVNTTAYKSQSMVFNDLLYQTTQAASGANDATGRGGINARQIGLGAKTGAISTAITKQGSAQSTNNPFDIMITGDSFFIVSNGSSNFFTRDGSFTIDGAGNLVSSSTGYTVMGWGTNEEGEIVPDTVQALQVMNADNLTYPPESTTKAYVSGILDKHSTDVNSKEGKIMTLNFFDQLGYKYTAKLSIHSTGSDGNYRVQLDDIIDSDGVSLVKKYNLADITEIATFGNMVTTETTTLYPLQQGVKVDLGQQPPVYEKIFPLGEVLKDYDTNIMIRRGTNIQVKAPTAGGSITAGTADAVTVTGKLEVTKSELESEYGLIYYVNKGGTDPNATGYYYKDTTKPAGIGKMISSNTDWQDALAAMGVSGITGTPTIAADGTVTLDYEIKFDAVMDAKFDGNDFSATISQLEAYGIDVNEDPNATYTVEFISPDGTSAQVKKSLKEYGNPLVFDTDTGKFKYVGSVNSKEVTLDFNTTAKTLTGETIPLTHFTDIDIDFSSATMFNNGGTSTIGATNGDKSGKFTGRKEGEMIGIEVGQDGTLTASYDNGQMKVLGQIAVANFANAMGLSKQGDNLYSATMNSGEFDGIGSNITAGGGYMTSGVLEMSNVDLSSEFTEMITTQRGFQANSRIITVSDTMIEELVNLKR